ncbi:MAG: site-specific integrase [Rhodothermales bacterium]|nr:site-specific integrase [Rhodothermales bacterium]
MAKPVPIDTSLTLTVAELNRRIEDFVKEYLKEKSPETSGTYRRSLNEFQRWFAREEGRFRFTPDDVEAYKTYLMGERGLHQVSVSTYLTALRRLCQYLMDIGLIADNPARAVKGNRRPNTHSRAVLTQGEIDELLGVIEQVSHIGLRDAALIHMMLYAGLSEIELIRANVQDLEQTLLGWFLRVQGKGHTLKDQQVPIDQPVMEKVQAYLASRQRVHPEHPLFVSHGHRSEGQRLNTRSVRSRINLHLKSAEIKRRGVTPHSLTHTAALLWLNKGMSLEEVRQRMRHGTLETTMIYFKKQGLLNLDSEELKKLNL